LSPGELSGALNDRANELKRRGRRAEAERLYRDALRADPDAPHPPYNLAKMLREDGAVGKAVAILERLLASWPDHFRARHDLGVCFEELGRFDEAVLEYQRVLEIVPGHAKAIANLLAIPALEPDAGLVALAQARLQASDCSAEDRARLHCALGKSFDRRGEFDQAFEQFMLSNASQAAGRAPFDPRALAADVSRLIAVFDAECLRQPRSGSSPSRVPILVVGLPRSGTSLVEQILATHSGVFGAGELRELPRIATEMEAGYPDAAPRMGPAALRRHAATYLQALSLRAPASARRIVDKLPGNFTRLGLARLLFPNAAFIHCRRHPLDVALSCYIERFAGHAPFGTDLVAIAHCIVQHDRLLAHWRTALTGSLHECEYAALVTEQRTATAGLLAACGLEWQERCLEFERTPRSVATPSRWQVRQPLYASSVSRWKNYSRQLEPVSRILESAGLPF
jgi:hypothetical protein